MEDLPSNKTERLINQFTSLKPKLLSGKELKLDFDTKAFKNEPVSIKLVPEQINQQNGKFSEEQLNSLWAEGKFEVDSGIQGYPFIWEENSVKLMSSHKMTDILRKDLSVSIEHIHSISTLFNTKNTTGSVIYGIKATFKAFMFYIDILFGFAAEEKRVSLEHIAFERQMEERFKLLRSLGIEALFEKENINKLIEIFKKLEKHLQKDSPEQEIRLKHSNIAKIQEEMHNYSVSFLNSEIEKLDNSQLKTGFKQYIRLTKEYFTYIHQVEESISDLYKHLIKEVNTKYPIMAESAGGKGKFIKKEIDEYKLKLIESLRNTHSSSKMIRNHLDAKWFHEKRLKEAKDNTSAKIKHYYYNSAMNLPILRGNGKLEYFEKMQMEMFQGWRLHFHLVSVWEELKVNFRLFLENSFTGVNGFYSLFSTQTIKSVYCEEQEKIVKIKENNTFWASCKDSSMLVKGPKFMLYSGIATVGLVLNSVKFVGNTGLSVSTEFMRYLKEILFFDSHRTIPKRCGYFPIFVNTVYLIRNGLANIALFPVILGKKMGFSLGRSCFSVFKYIFFFILKTMSFNLLKYTSSLPKNQSNIFKLVSGPGIDSNAGKKTSLKEALVLIKANLTRLEMKHQKAQNEKKIKEYYTQMEEISKESEKQGLNLKLTREEEKEVAHLISMNQKYFSSQTKSLPQTINVRFTKIELITLFTAVEELLAADKPEFVLKEFNSKHFKLVVPALIKDSLGSFSLHPVEDKYKLTKMRLEGSIDMHIEELKSKIPSLTAILGGKNINSSYWTDYLSCTSSPQNWITRDNLFSTDNPFYIPSLGPFKTFKRLNLVCRLM